MCVNVFRSLRIHFIIYFSFQLSIEAFGVRCSVANSVKIINFLFNFSAQKKEHENVWRATCVCFIHFPILFLNNMYIFSKCHYRWQIVIWFSSARFNSIFCFIIRVLLSFLKTFFALNSIEPKPHWYLELNKCMNGIL